LTFSSLFRFKIIRIIEITIIRNNKLADGKDKFIVDISYRVTDTCEQILSLLMQLNELVIKNKLLFKKST